MIDVGRFAKPLPFKNGVLRLGIEGPAAVAAELRAFADRVESGEIVILKVQSATVVEHDRWMEKAIMIEFDELELSQGERQPPERVIDLAGND